MYSVLALFVCIGSYNVIISALEFEDDLNETRSLDLLTVIDHSVFMRFHALGVDEEDLCSTVDSIELFFNHIIDGINQCFNKINGSNFSIAIRHAGFHIAMYPEEAIFTKLVTNTDGLTNATDVLFSFIEWVGSFDHKPYAPKFDAALMFTAGLMDMDGLARLGSVCTRTGLGVVRMLGQIQTINTAAHELAHILGSRHDGAGNNCRYGDNGIMKFDALFVPGEKTYKFSNCTLNQLRQRTNKAHILKCLIKNETSLENTTSYLTVLPGERLDVDDQCKLEFGNGSFLCRMNQTKPDELCSRPLCYDTTRKICSKHFPAADGTPCQSNSWCIRGMCVSNIKASILPEFCIFGDVKESFKIPEIGEVKCQQLTHLQLEIYCSMALYGDFCCRTCQDIVQKKQITSENSSWSLIPGQMALELQNVQITGVNKCLLYCIATQNCSLVSFDPNSKEHCWIGSTTNSSRPTDFVLNDYVTSFLLDRQTLEPAIGHCWTPAKTKNVYRTIYTNGNIENCFQFCISLENCIGVLFSRAKEPSCTALAKKNQLTSKVLANDIYVRDGTPAYLLDRQCISRGKSCWTVTPGRAHPGLSPMETNNSKECFERCLQLDNCTTVNYEIIIIPPCWIEQELTEEASLNKLEPKQLVVNYLLNRRCLMP